VAVWDPGTIIDRATYERPRQAPAGVTAVLVNGQFVVRAGRAVDVLAGHVLRRPAR
jgi:N-acyl-D-amino-acid deacylase